MEVEFLLNSPWGWCPQQLLLAHLCSVWVNTGKDGHATHFNILCACMCAMGIWWACRLHSGIYTRSSVFIFIVVSKSAYFLGSDGVTKRQFQQKCPWATFWEKRWPCRIWNMKEATMAESLETNPRWSFCGWHYPQDTHCSYLGISSWDLQAMVTAGSLWPTLQHRTSLLL